MEQAAAPPASIPQALWQQWQDVGIRCSYLATERAFPAGINAGVRPRLSEHRFEEAWLGCDVQSPAAGSLLCHVCNELAGLSLLQPRKVGQPTLIGMAKEKNSLETGLDLTHKGAWPLV